MVLVDFQVGMWIGIRQGEEGGIFRGGLECGGKAVIAWEDVARVG